MRCARCSRQASGSGGVSLARAVTVRGRGLSERRALRRVVISASTLHYEPRDDGNGRLCERLTQRAVQHRRHGYRMLHSRLRIEGWAINVERTCRLYREEGLMVRKRRRKKLPVCPSGSPWCGQRNPTKWGAWTSCSTSWPMAGESRRCPSWTTAARRRCRSRWTPRWRRYMSPECLIRVLDQVRVERGLPKVIRTDNGSELAGGTMQIWTARNGVELPLSSTVSRCRTPTSRASTAALGTTCPNTGSLA